ncbi:hypothetical protein G6F62_006804 [Rhizopus arrhizus]|nr:hypothetical protein G6F23_001788 [Rhizopus arrhizus]KAG0794624.1 hypothetical protein G6F21_002734 [Rhizopus arrhizus]KAG0802059.1 hypothetical protein G6F22_000636 [Rhizopus arrhizus]KAG0815642.1 hypothetical protein G6F20_003822 [Rhizopus arrhizus]KAG0839802.1 hypothetical protein G6F18_003929 [Rhizopus arrhizus]
MLIDEEDKILNIVVIDSLIKSTLTIISHFYSKDANVNKSLRIKSGEPIFDVSTANKKELYPNRKYIKGFKIDIRFVMDVDGKEIDLAAARVAKDVSKNKTMLDEGKLTREGKDIVDNLVDILSNIDLKSRQAYLTLDLARVAGCLELRSIISNGRMGTVESLGINQLSRTITKCVNWTRPTYHSPPGSCLGEDYPQSNPEKTIETICLQFSMLISFVFS